MFISKLKSCFSKSRFYASLQDNSTDIFCLLCFLASNICLTLFLLPSNSPIGGHDSPYHYLRVEAVKYNIENHNLFSGIDYLYFGGGGYASFAYPDIFLYIPAFLRTLGMGIGDSMAVFLTLCNAFSYCFMFIFLRDISGSRICGTMGAVLYVLSTYRLDNIIERFALGEILAYVFWPLILYGLYDFIFGEFKKPYILGLGFVGMLLSHSISTALALGLCVLFSIIFIRRIFKARGKLPRLFITAGCAVAVTAYYWLPLLELLFSCEMSVKIPAYHTLDYVIPFTGLFKEVMHNGIGGMGFPVFLLCVPRIFLLCDSPVSKQELRDEGTGRRKNILVAADTFMIIGIILALMATSVFPWKILSKVLDFMQFPWRFFAPSSILLIIAGTIYIYYIARFTKATKAVMMVVTAVAILIAGVHTGISGVYHHDPYENDHYSNTENTFSVGQGEWLPRAAQSEGINLLRTLGDNVILSNDQLIPCERHNGDLTFDLGENEGIEFAKLPYIWYNGYEAKDENGKDLEIKMSDNGLVQVDLHAANGVITVEHKPTALKIAGYIISAVSIAVIITLSIVFYRRRKRAERLSSK